MTRTEHPRETTWTAPLRARLRRVSAESSGPDDPWAALPSVVLAQLDRPDPAALRAFAAAQLPLASGGLADALRFLQASRGHACAQTLGLGLPAEQEQAARDFLLGVFDDLQVAVAEAWSEARWPRPPRHRRLEAVGQLAAGLAHEVNTPVQFLADNIEFLGDAVQVLLELTQAHRIGLEDLADSGGALGAEWLAQADEEEEAADVEFLVEELPGALQQSARGLEHVCRMVKGLEAFSAAPGAPVATDVNALVEMTAALLVPSFDTSIELRLDLDPAAPHIDCDPRALRQVVFDLVDNAGRAIEQALSPRPSRLGHVVVRTRRDADTVRIEVQDDADGIPVCFHAHLFEPGFSSWQREGLGLAYARDVVEGMQGDLRLLDAPEGGTIAQVSLPI